MVKRNDVQQSGKIQRVPLGKLTPSPWVQRDFKQYHADQILANFDLDDFGVPVVNHRDGAYYIIDGQHRIFCLKEFLGEGNDNQLVECRVFEELNKQQEADMYDRLSTTLSQTAFQKFKNRVLAGREIEVGVQKVVDQAGLCVSREDVPGAIGAVGTLRRVYVRSGADSLGQALRIIRDAYGDAGFEAQVIDGMGHLCQRYSGALDEKVVVERLGAAHGGVKGLLGKAYAMHKQTGSQKAHCIAAAAVDIINTKRGGKKLPSWWHTNAS